MYQLTRVSGVGVWFIGAPQTFLEPDKDYDLELRMRWGGGRPDQLFGLVYQTESADNCNALGITSQGGLAAFRYEQGAYLEVQPTTLVSVVSKGQEWNVVTLRKRGSALAVVVNGETVTYLEKPRQYGRLNGICVTGPMIVEVDYFLIRQNQGPIRLASDHPVNVKRENLGPAVNSSGGDLSPVITADGRYLFIGRYPYAGNIGNPEMEDIYVSEKKADGTWGAMTNVGRPLNNEASNFLISITPDLNTVLLGNTYRPDGGPMGGGVSISHRTATGWEIPKPVMIDRFYNRSKYSEMCLDPSGQHLIMALQRDDSKGANDLYMSTRLPNGAFSEPRNLTMLNTWGMEMSPFVAADATTMYFATDGRHGYGSMDIWMTRRLDDTWMNWSEPENLGPSINTDQWDAYFTVPASGDYAYLSASNDENRSIDIYRVKLTDGVKPRPVFLVRGRVLDASTKQPLAAGVDYESLTRRTSVGAARSALPAGTYAIALPAGDLYGFRAEAEVQGYYPVSDQLDARALTSYTEIERDLYLVPLRANEMIKLANIFFDFGQTTLRPESVPELDRLATFLKSRSTMTIELHGHTDNVGSDADNRKLSKERVESVKSYLVSAGIDATRLKTVGHGKSKPVASNDTEEGRQQNRRVEFKVIKL
jgi:outer membrane protein OmpA-like peptidoglycan-associated protein